MSDLRYLERYFDSQLILPEKVDVKYWTLTQIDRLARALAIVTVTGSMPRRLGGDASSDDLAVDKKRSRRVGHALRASLSAWELNAPELPTGDEIRVAGAQLDWQPFIEQHIVTAKAALIEMATWSILNDRRSWGKTVVTRIQNEIKWIEYGMRD